MFRRRAVQADLVAVPRVLFEEQQEELARLRLEQHRPLTLAQAGRAARAVADTVDADSAWHAVAEAQALSALVSAVLRDLRIACMQLERQMEIETPAAEIDRRVSHERRRAPERTLTGLDDTGSQQYFFIVPYPQVQQDSERVFA